MVHQIVELSRELQEARDSKVEACVMCRQRVQMFRGFSARVIAGAWLMAPEDSLCVVNNQPVGNPKRKV
jgi:hypothetical protein